MIGLQQFLDVADEVNALNVELRERNPDITLEALAKAGLPSNVDSDATETICNQNLTFARDMLQEQYGSVWNAEAITTYALLMWWAAFVLGVRVRDPDADAPEDGGPLDVVLGTGPQVEVAAKTAMRAGSALKLGADQMGAEGDPALGALDLPRDVRAAYGRAMIAVAELCDVVKPYVPDGAS